jgi:dTDP-4-amino-4,6-dideoxygalactose transaminase
MAYPFVAPGAVAAVAAVLESRWVGQGPRVEEFERAFEARFGLLPGTAVAVNSGTSALELAYDLLGLGPGDRVITTALTCTATNIPLVRRDCLLEFADIRRDTLTLDPAAVARIVASGTAIRAIVNVHLHGVVSELPGHSGIPVVDDAAQALGAPRLEARFTAYSFQAIKHITTGDGGMLVCRDPADAAEARLRRWFGIDRQKKLENQWQPFLRREILFDIEYPGYKWQMNDIAAALGLAGLACYDEILQERRQIFRVYRSFGLPLVAGVGVENRYGYACVLVEDRERFCAELAAAEIETNVMQVRNDRYEIFRAFRRPLPNLDWVEPRYVCLPLHNRMTLDDACYVADAAARALVTA